MSSPMPFVPGSCSLCFDTIYDGEHFVDDMGQKWDVHSWCNHLDMAMLERNIAAKKRQSNNQPCIED